MIIATDFSRLVSTLSDRYRVERELGAGGMATVYLAYDIKHDRKVAIKVLKPELAAVLGAERFVVEIKTTASLQHPHILPLFDSGEARHPDGREAAGGSAFLYYVMPYIQGETIREKLNRETQFGVDEAIRIAREVADALDYAHRHGVIHRDIKPENILLYDGRAMVMDFGIALAVSAAAGGRMTETGLSLGTPHYMSPEQATAEKEVSGRSDIYSLASVLYEMLTGNPPHTGASAQQIIMKIVTEEAAPVTKLRKAVPPNVAAAVAKALEKLPADRFESAAMFAAALGNPAFVHRPGTPMSHTAAGVTQHWNRLTAGLAAIAAILVVLLGATNLSRRGESGATSPVVRFSLADDPSLRIDASSTKPFAISPDGRTIVFRASTDSTSARLWVRTIDNPHARPLEGTTDGSNPAISPDGNWVAFVVGNLSLRKVRLAGGDASVITQLDAVTAALSWASDGEIVLEQIAPDGGIQRVNAGGGRPQLLIPIDTAAREARQRRPLVLRGAGLVVYASYTDAGSEPTLVLYRMSDGRRVRLGLAGNGPLDMIDDRLVYSRIDGTLTGVTLDVRTMKAGTPVIVTPRVASVRTGNTVGLSEGGTLVYRTADASTAAHLDLADTSGTVRRIRGEFAVLRTPRFSPDGRRIVVEVGAAGAESRVAGISMSDLWIIDLASGEPTRITTGSVAAAPSWSPDGKRLVYLTAADSALEVWSTPVDGSVPASRASVAKGFFVATSMMPDGRSVVVQAQASRAIARGAGLLRIWIDGSARVDTVTPPSARGLRPEAPRVSPDGRWVAFVDRTTSDVWVRSMSGATLMQVTTSGTDGEAVVWGADSRHLYHMSRSLGGGTGEQFWNGIVVIDLRTEPNLEVIRRRVVRGLPANEGYDLSPDGKTFIVVSPIRATTGIVAVVNWADDARRQWRGAGKP